MSWNDQDPDYTPGAEGEEPEDDAQAAQVDLLADADDETRAAFEARLQAEREAAQAAVRAEMEEQFARDKAQLNAGLRQRLKDVTGVEIGEDGLPVAADPMRLATYAAQQLQQGRATAPEPEEEMPDPTYQAEEFRAWQKRQVDRARQEAVAAAKAELNTELQQMRQLLGSAVLAPAAQHVSTAAQSYLAELGFEDYAKDPAFAAEVTKLVQANVAPAEWNDPKHVRQAVALVALDRDPDFLAKAAALGAQRQQQQPRDPNSGQFVNASRQGLPFAQPGGGTAGRLGDGGPRLSPEQQVLFQGMQQAGVVADVGEFLALQGGDDTARDYYAKRHRKNGKN